MGKNTELKSRLAACDALIKGIADALELDINEDIDLGNVARYSTMFLTSLGRSPTATPPPLAIQPFEQLVDEENRRIDQAVHTGSDSPSMCIITAGQRGHQDAFNTRASLELLADELDIGPDARTFGSFALVNRILEAVSKLKTPEPQDHAGAVTVPTNDSFAQAIAHERAQRRELEEALVGARGIINRVAGAMQIDRWDAEGTELVQRAQRWASFKVTLLAVANQWRARPGAEAVSVATVAQQIQSLLATIASSHEFARWLENKPKTLSVSDILAIPPPSVDDRGKFAPGDIIRIHQCVADRLAAAPDPLIEYLERTFLGIASSVAVSKEFVDLMNAVILPILARQSPAAPAKN